MWLKPYRDVLVVHHMDDIMLAHPSLPDLERVSFQLLLNLEKLILTVVPEKIQRVPHVPSWAFLFLTRLSLWSFLSWQKSPAYLWNYNSCVELLTGSNLSCLFWTRRGSSLSARVKGTSEASNLLQKLVLLLCVSTLERHA